MLDGDEEQGHEIDPDVLIADALKEKGGQGQDAGDEDKPKVTPAPVKPAPVATGTATEWFLAEREVRKTAPDLDAEDIELLKAASGGDPIRFVDLAEKQQAKRAALKVAAKPESEQEELKKKAAAEIFGGGGPGGEGSNRPKEPTPQEKVKAAVEKGDTHGIQRGMVEVINQGNAGKPLFKDVKMEE